MYTYDPLSVVGSWGTIIFSGYADGVMIKAERNSEDWKTSVGTQGSVTRVRGYDETGKVTVTLKQTSPVNDLLMAQAQLDRSTGLGALPLQFTDISSGTAQVFAAHAWVEKIPAFERGKEEANVEWVFSVDKLAIQHGGNPVTV